TSPPRRRRSRGGGPARGPVPRAAGGPWRVEEHVGWRCGATGPGRARRGGDGRATPSRPPGGGVGGSGRGEIRTGSHAAHPKRRTGQRGTALWPKAAAGRTLPALGGPTPGAHRPGRHKKEQGRVASHPPQTVASSGQDRPLGLSVSLPSSATGFTNPVASKRKLGANGRRGSS